MTLKFRGSGSSPIHSTNYVSEMQCGCASGKEFDDDMRHLITNLREAYREVERQRMAFREIKRREEWLAETGTELPAVLPQAEWCALLHQIENQNVIVVCGPELMTLESTAETRCGEDFTAAQVSAALQLATPHAGAHRPLAGTRAAARSSPRRSCGICASSPRGHGKARSSFWTDFDTIGDDHGPQNFYNVGGRPYRLKPRWPRNEDARFLVSGYSPHET